MTLVDVVTDIICPCCDIFMMDAQEVRHGKCDYCDDCTDTCFMA